MILSKHITKIFCVSLREREDRRVVFDYQMQSSGVEFEYFYAKPGGVTGLVDTMQKLLRRCMIFGYKRVLIFEDDAMLLRGDWQAILSRAIEQSPNNTTLIYLGVNLFQDDVHLATPNLINVTSGYTSHAVVYTPLGMLAALGSIAKHKTAGEKLKAYDTMLVEDVQSEGHAYTTFPMLCTQANGMSDIRKKKINYERLIQKRFEKKTEHLWSTQLR